MTTPPTPPTRPGARFTNIPEGMETQVHLPLSQLVRSGQTKTVRRGESLYFTDPKIGWVLESGVLEVQASKFDRGEPRGNRRNLFALLPGQGVFGFDPVMHKGRQGWLGFAGEECVVREIELSSFARAFLQGDRAANNMLSNWVKLLSASAGEGKAPPASLARLPDKADEYEFGKKESMAADPDGFLWVHVDSGIIALFGHEGLQLTAEAGYLLAGGDLWFEVMSDTAEIATKSRHLLNNPAMVASGLELLHMVFSSHLHSLQRETERAEMERRQNSQALRQLESQAAVQDLSSVLNPVEVFPLRENALLTAATVIGSLIGVPINPPLASEDLNRVHDPVEPIARASKIRYRKILLGPNWWKKDVGPFIGFLGEERSPIALVPSSTSYDIVDPESRVRTPITEEQRGALHPDGYVLYRPLFKDMKTLKDLATFTFRGKGPDLAFVLFCAMCSTLIGMLTPRVTASVVDTAIPAADTSFLVQLAMLLFIAGWATAIFSYVQSMAMVRTSVRTEDTAQAALWDRLLRASPKFFRKFPSGELAHRVEAVSEISRDLNIATLRPLFSGVMAILNWLLLWYYSWDLAYIALWIGLVVLVVIVFIGTMVRRLSTHLYTVEGHYHGFVIQLIRGVSKIRVAGSEERAFNRWIRYYSENLKLSMRIARWKDAAKLVNSILIPCATALLFWKAVKLTIDAPLDSEDKISIGDFVAFNAAFLLYLIGWQDISNALVQVMDSASKLDRVRALLQEPPEIGDDATDPGRIKGDIALDNVSFRYRADGPLIIDRTSIRIRPGEYVAFVGPSGSGKSTILRLLLGLERPDDGRVLYDGKDLMGLDALAVRRQIGTVLQEGRLNGASILDNISNNAKVTLGEVWDAVADAGMTEDIQSMPMGLHTMISEGGWNISGGQRQRLLIARAMVVRPKIFMFDEATSALDNKTQAVVSAALDKRKCTRIVIAHRLSTIRQADRILVMNGGKIVQDGTFAELSAAPGMFKDLMARQMV